VGDEDERVLERLASTDLEARRRLWILRARHGDLFGPANAVTALVLRVNVGWATAYDPTYDILESVASVMRNVVRNHKTPAASRTEDRNHNSWKTEHGGRIGFLVVSDPEKDTLTVGVAEGTGKRDRNNNPVGISDCFPELGSIHLLDWSRREAINRVQLPAGIAPLVCVEIFRRAVTEYVGRYM
jgi:hypothetical protein